MNSNSEIWRKVSDTPQNYQYMGQISKAFSNIWFREALTVSISKYFIYFKNDKCSVYFLKSEIEQNSRDLIDKIINNPGWGIKLLNRTEKAHIEFFDYTESFRKIEFNKQSDNNLLKLLKDAHILSILGHEVTRSISWILDKDNKRLNEAVSEMVENQIEKKGKNFKSKIILPELTTSLKDTFVYKEQLMLLSIAKKIVKNNEIKDIFINYNDEKKILEEVMKKDDKIYNLIFNHYKNYRWLSYLYQKPAYKQKYYVNRLKDFARDEATIGKLLSRYKNGKKKTQDVRKILLNELDFNKKHLQILEFVRELTYIRDFRKAIIAHSTFCMKRLFSEMSNRFNASMDQIRMMDYQELKDAVRNNNFDTEELDRRIKEALFYYERGQERRIMSGNEAQKFVNGIKIESRDNEKIKEVEGQIANTGKTQGTVRIINRIDELDKMREGDLLVTQATNFELSPAVNKAAGIITECGGLTCHAAIIAREINIPCLVGVDDATKILKDGDKIELDAENGTIKKL